MVTRKVKISSQNHAFLYIPAYLRDKFGLKKGSTVDITDEDGKIVITPIDEETE